MTALASEPDILVIRHAKAQDAEAIAALIVEAFQEHAWIRPEISALRETPDAILRRLSCATGLLAETGGEVVACVFFEPKMDPRHVYLSRLAVSPQFRGLGIARRLIAEVERFARDNGFDLVRLATRCDASKNVALYETLGYRAYDYASHHGAERVTTVMFEKQIG